ncbi:MAG: hypothetical protein ACREOB_05670 [Thermodesulfobacteriota bacterium]
MNKYTDYDHSCDAVIGRFYGFAQTCNVTPTRRLAIRDNYYTCEEHDPE